VFSKIVCKLSQYKRKRKVLHNVVYLVYHKKSYDYIWNFNFIECYNTYMALYYVLNNNPSMSNACQDLDSTHRYQVFLSILEIDQHTGLVSGHNPVKVCINQSNYHKQRRLCQICNLIYMDVIRHDNLSYVEQMFWPHTVGTFLN